jgi:hypothetical protein
MRTQHRREAEAAVVIGVGLAPDPEEAEIEEADRAGEHALASEAIAGEPAARLRPQGPEGVGEVEHALELLPVAPLAPGVVVEVLPPSGRVHSSGLEMAERIGADPHVRPRWRNRQRADPPELVPVSERPAVLPAVLEAAATPAPGDSRLRAVATAQAWHGSASSV